MKNIFKFLFLSLLCLSVLVGCSKAKDDSVILVGATPEPHAEMLKLIIDDMEKEGYSLKIVEFTDYNTPNEALEGEQIDANFFQHLPYMDSFNEKGYHLVNAGGIHIEPVALYSKKIKSLDELKEGSTVAIPNDPTNEGRALLLLQSAGVIQLDEKAGITATPLNIVSNPKKIKFHEIEAASLPRILNDVDAAIINGNYAISAGLSAKKDGIYVEGADSPYVNIIAVKAGNENSEKVKSLVKALQTEEIKKFISDNYPNGEVVSVF